MDENKFLERITFNPKIFGGKPVIRGRRLYVEHVFGMHAAEDTPEKILKGYPLGDAEILEQAHRKGRVMVNLEKDFGQLAIVHERSHLGIIR